MAVVRIDDDLLKKLKELLKKDENKYRYSSITGFLNSIVHEKIKEEEKAKK
jgi:hypothetical protein